MDDFSKKNLIFVVRTKSISGNMLDVVEYVCNEFIVSKQTAKKIVQEGSLLVCLGTDESDGVNRDGHDYMHI